MTKSSPTLKIGDIFIGGAKCTGNMTMLYLDTVSNKAFDSPAPFFSALSLDAPPKPDVDYNLAWLKFNKKSCLKFFLQTAFLFLILLLF